MLLKSWYNDEVLFNGNHAQTNDIYLFIYLLNLFYLFILATNKLTT